MGLHDSIERFAQEMGWVVKYADDGTPNFFIPSTSAKALTSTRAFRSIRTRRLSSTVRKSTAA